MADRPPDPERPSATAAGNGDGGSGDANSRPHQTEEQRPRVVGGGFAAMVDAFMSSFRQASAVQSQPQSQTQQHQAAQTGAPPDNTQTGLFVSPATASPEQDTASNQQGATSQTIPPRDATTEEAATSPHEEPSNDHAISPPSEARVNASSSDQAAPPPTDDSQVPRVLYFRMPFFTQDGQSATLAFHPGPIPVPARRPLFTDRPIDLSPERGNGRASGFHLPTAPIFVPAGASPLPYSFIFDTQTNTGWPIASNPLNPAGIIPPLNSDAVNEPGFVAGPPFHIALNISFGPPPQAEVPDPERASRFVDSLERADAELRDRMSRLGMGAIGDYGGRQDNEGGEGALGCGICLDEYLSEDRPEWIGGQASKDEEVVAVPCAGHHTLHHRCLYDWLSKTPPSEWTCPFCRAGLDKQKVEKSANSSEQQQQQQPRTSGPASPPSDAAKSVEQEAKARSLRDEVRWREKKRGWRCDAPACLPRYPRKNSASSFARNNSNRLVSLMPCRHQLHLDCLCTSMKLEHADFSDAEDDESDEDDEEEEEEDDANEGSPSPSSCAKPNSILEQEDSAIETVGKWVNCLKCRKEAFVELPKKRSKRVAVAEAKAAANEESVDKEWQKKSQSSSQPPPLFSNREVPSTPLFGAREEEEAGV
ncbi:hypothetical protein CBS101457_000791 [Exobasidium rhododendri]|nr:hypothetical protein CBS101457_000791 [Exobasidium rhododendri]